MKRDSSSGVLAAVRHGTGRRIPRTDVEVARAAANDPDARLATQAELAGALRSDGGAGKVQITLRLDAAVVNAYKATGKGWQTRLNAVLAAAPRVIRTISRARSRKGHNRRSRLPRSCG